ncbi:caprin homolog [Maniola hyperantus]|uniref:caprin homolog n=1 Tax=Aphantopus hyperantus TaxID=2795564 RepID=UPI001569108B|nr:caprin homolog [Maniola hyperantus]
MPSAANAKSEKPASSEASDNSPIRQVMTIIEHKIRNLEKRKSKLTSYRDLQKAGKELNGDQKVAVAKYDEVVQTLEFARDMFKQVVTVATVAERDAKKQAKKDAWVRYTAETNKIREVLLVLDCLMQMGNAEAREDFLNGSNGAAKLTEDDLKILDDLYPEVTPKHDVNEEGQPGFLSYTVKAAEHLYAIIDGKPKEFLGTTYAHIKEIINAVHECGYFDKSLEVEVAAEPEECPVPEEEPEPEPAPAPPEPEVAPAYAPAPLPAPPAPAGLPAPAYPLRPLPPITLQEVEHAYFAQQYPQQRPIAEVIGSQNFFFLQESEIDSPVGTPQPPPILNQQGSPAPIPTQTFTNQHYVLPGGRVPEPGTIPMPPQPHFPPHPEPAVYPVPLAAPLPHVHVPPQPIPQPIHVEQQIQIQPEERKLPTPVEDVIEENSKESRSPERDDGDRKTQGQGDGQNRFRRYRGGGRGSSNGFRGRGSFQNRQNNDNYHGRHGEYQNRSNKDGYRQYSDNYQSRHGKDGYQNRGGNDAYYGNGDTGDSHHNENGGRERYNDAGYQGGFKSRGRGGPRGARGAPRAPRPHQYARKPDNVE